jgi:hypothetical protein
MKNQRGCTKCDYEVTGKETKCPQCGGWIRRARRIRRLGFALVAIGFFLVAMMGIITIMLAPMMLSAGQESGGTRFSGTPEQGMMILGLFGLVIVFGVAAILAGVFQLATGRRSIWIMIAVFGLAFLLYIAGQAVRTALDRSSLEPGPREISESSLPT